MILSPYLFNLYDFSLSSRVFICFSQVLNNYKSIGQAVINHIVIEKKKKKKKINKRTKDKQAKGSVN